MSPLFLKACKISVTLFYSRNYPEIFVKPRISEIQKRNLGRLNCLLSSFHAALTFRFNKKKNNRESSIKLVLLSGWSQVHICYVEVCWFPALGSVYKGNEYFVKPVSSANSAAGRVQLPCMFQYYCILPAEMNRIRLLCTPIFKKNGMSTLATRGTLVKRFGLYDFLAGTLAVGSSGRCENGMVFTWSLCKALISIAFCVLLF